MPRELWICWKLPTKLLREKTNVLSFLLPSQEATIEGAAEFEQFFSGRILSREIKEHARQTYVQIVADIGIASDEKGRTFRQQLTNGQGESRWWYHKVSEKNCEDHPTFDQIIQVFTIAECLRRVQANKIVLWGCPSELAEVLKKSFAVKENVKPAPSKGRRSIAQALLARLKFGMKTIYQILIVRTVRRDPLQCADIVLSGFWDWSIRKDSAGVLEDRYFKNLPTALAKEGIDVSWMVWLDHRYGVDSASKTTAQALAPLKNDGRVFIGQSFLKIKDVLGVLFDPKPFAVYRSFLKRRSFRQAFQKDGIDFFPLFESYLAEGFLGQGIPRLELISLAHQRFASKFKPQIFLSFLDLFLYARAVNSGIRLGHSGTVRLDMQHASCSREKIFYVIHPLIEQQGQPDSLMMPQPDRIYAMGRLGKDIFESDGFAASQVIATGSVRYDSLPLSSSKSFPAKKERWNILIVTGMDAEKEIEMIDGVAAAAKQFSNFNVVLRFHPFSDIRKHPQFFNYQDQIRCSSGTSLAQDLDQADVVIFSYSTVGEESLLRGKAVWQWVSAGYNASVFRDLPIVPQFSSVLELKRLLKSFFEEPWKFVPQEDHQRLVAEQCFYADPSARPSERIAKDIKEWLRKK